MQRLPSGPRTNTLLENAVRISVACDYDVAAAPGKAGRSGSASESIRDGEWPESDEKWNCSPCFPRGPVPIENPESLISTHFPASRRRTLFLNDMIALCRLHRTGTQAVEAAFQTFGLDTSALPGSATA